MARCIGLPLVLGADAELVETYRKAILSAFEDVEKALAGTSRLGERSRVAWRPR
jgi:hypothetical protein